MSINLYRLAGIDTEENELERIRKELGAGNDASARPFLPAYRALVSRESRPIAYFCAKNARLSKKHPVKRQTSSDVFREYYDAKFASQENK